MKKQIKLMADYNCWPLWQYEDNDLVDNLHPSELSLSSEIKERLLNWQNIYDGIMNWDDPASSDFASEAEKMAFEKEGINLWQLLQKELGNEYEVVYFSAVQRRVLSGLDEEISQLVRLSSLRLFLMVLKALIDFGNQKIYRQRLKLLTKIFRT